MRSFHSLITFLPLLCNCQFRRLDSIQFLCFQGHILAGWRLETQVILLYNHFSRTSQKIQPLYCWEGVFTPPLHSNGIYCIVAFVFVAAGMCLPSRCLAMNIYSDFNIPAFGRHVTLFTCIVLRSGKMVNFKLLVLFILGRTPLILSGYLVTQCG
jgi:hypothetical protein